MRVIPTRLREVLLVEPRVHQDPRGFFLESYSQKHYAGAGIAANFVQDNHSRSAKGTLRGLHAQLKRPQGKLIRVLQGEIFDVAVDVRPQSGTFGQWVGQILSAENFLQLYIPPGFFHGFCVLSPTADVEYKCSEFYDAADEVGLRWDDPDLRIQWPVTQPILSDKDKKLPSLKEIRNSLEAYRSLK